MTFNRQVTLRKCLESLSCQTLDSDRLEVVVVDGSEEPARSVVADFADRLQIHHVVGPNLGIARNRNRGADHARAKYLAFLDDDCVAQPDWLEKLREAVSAHSRVMIGGGVENVHPENACSVAGQVITEAVMSYFNPPGEEPTFFPGLNFAIERAAYLEIGGCHHEFALLGGGEDREFVERFRALGGRLIACPGAIVRHEHRSSLRRFMRQYFGYGRGAWVYQRLTRKSGQAKASIQASPPRSLFTELHAPLARLNREMWFKVVLLIGVWQVFYKLGILSQALIELPGFTQKPEPSIS